MGRTIIVVCILKFYCTLFVRHLKLSTLYIYVVDFSNIMIFCQFSERQNDVHDFPSDTYENMSDSEYEEIATVSNSTEEHNHYRPMYQNADGDEMPTAYEDLQGFSPEIHTYLKCNVNEEQI